MLYFFKSLSHHVKLDRKSLKESQVNLVHFQNKTNFENKILQWTNAITFVNVVQYLSELISV